MDIDLDLPTTFNPKEIFPTAVIASRIDKERLVKHNAGVYFQHIPTDPITGFAAIPYDQAEEFGYLKIDCLHLNLLALFKSKDEMRDLLKKEPNWELLRYPDNVEKLFQIHQQFDLINKIKPKSIIELADCIALMRPAKRKYLSAYLHDRTEVRKFLYKKPDDGGYYYKKPHAVAYAINIVLQLHLIEQGRL